MNSDRGGGGGFRGIGFFDKILVRSHLRVQVPNNHILPPNLYYNHYYPNPKYLNIGYLDP